MQAKLHNMFYNVRDEQAQGMVEYALIIGVVALGVIAALTFLRGALTDMFNRTASSINDQP